MTVNVTRPNFGLTKRYFTERVQLSAVPPSELQHWVALHVAEVCAADKAGFDELTQDRLTLEILAGMNR